MLKGVGKYLSKSKATVKHICEYIYGKSVSMNAVPNGKREFEVAYILDIFHFFRVVDSSGDAEICDSEAVKPANTALTQ